MTLPNQNACEGIADPKELRQQRDQCLRACIMVKEWCEDYDLDMEVWQAVVDAVDRCERKPT